MWYLGGCSTRETWKKENKSSEYNLFLMGTTHIRTSLAWLAKDTQPRDAQQALRQCPKLLRITRTMSSVLRGYWFST